MVSSTPRPYFTPGKDPVAIVQEAGWAPGPVWTGGKSRPTGIRYPDRPARSQSLYRLSYQTHTYKNVTNGIVEKSNTSKEVTSKMFIVTMQSLYQVNLKQNLK